MSDDPGAAGGQGDLVSRLRAVVEAKDEQIAALTAALEARWRLGAGDGGWSCGWRRWNAGWAWTARDSGTPCSKERIGAKEARRARQQSERERSKDRKRGGQPGHQGKGLRRDPDPGERKDADAAGGVPVLPGAAGRGGGR